MNKIFSVVAGLGLMALCSCAAEAQAASSSLILNFTAPASQSVTCTASYPTGQTSFITPVVANTVVASCVVAPSTWSGVLSISGPDASFFAMAGNNVAVGASPITVPRTYNVTITATP